MNWYKKLIESASLLHVSPRYKGKDSGTAGAKPMDITNNERIFPKDGVMYAVPENWNNLSDKDKIEYINDHVKLGKLRFPSSVEKWLSYSFTKDPSAFLHAITVCLGKYSKLPNFTREWIDLNWEKNSFPEEFKKVLNSVLQIFPENRRKPFMLFESPVETIFENSVKNETPTLNQTNTDQAKIAPTNKTKPKYEEVYDHFFKKWVKKKVANNCNVCKLASFVDGVQTLSAGDGFLVVSINGKRYEYTNVPGKVLMQKIDTWKKWKNKNLAGEKLSALLKNLQPNLLTKQMGLFT